MSESCNAFQANGMEHEVLDLCGEEGGQRQGHTFLGLGATRCVRWVVPWCKHYCLASAWHTKWLLHVLCPLRSG